MTRRLPDADLFELAMRDVAPLRRTRKKTAAAAAIEPPPATPSARPRAMALFSIPAAPAPPRRTAAEPGLDRNTARRFERGELPIDRAIDLHGLTQARAHEALDRFVGDSVAAGARMLLIVTGKGKAGEGVLRRQVPEWLRAGPYAGRILRQANARLPHGGDGALYVLLRRNR
jgi:DNA-nicking Smr family endonuclease